MSSRTFISRPHYHKQCRICKKTFWDSHISHLCPNCREEAADEGTLKNYLVLEGLPSSQISYENTESNIYNDEESNSSKYQYEDTNISKYNDEETNDSNYEESTSHSIEEFEKPSYPQYLYDWNSKPIHTMYEEGISTYELDDDTEYSTDDKSLDISLMISSLKLEEKTQDEEELTRCENESENSKHSIHFSNQSYFNSIRNDNKYNISNIENQDKDIK